jgi:hypothetical protein
MARDRKSYLLPLESKRGDRAYRCYGRENPAALHPSQISVWLPENRRTPSERAKNESQTSSADDAA